MSDFKLGPIDGAAALIVLVVAILAAVCLVAVLIVSIIKAVKERNDQKKTKPKTNFCRIRRYRRGIAPQSKDCSKAQRTLRAYA